MLCLCLPCQCNLGDCCAYFKSRGEVVQTLSMFIAFDETLSKLDTGGGGGGGGSILLFTYGLSLPGSVK